MPSNLLVLFVLLLLAGNGVRSDLEAAVDGSGYEVVVEASPSKLELDIEQLKSEISALESSILGQIHESKSKDDNILLLEKTIQEKSAKIASLQSEIELAQKKGSANAEELVGKANEHARELENQVDKLKKEFETESKIRDDLIARATEADKKAQELAAKLKFLQKETDNLKSKLQKTERALKVAEEELRRAQLQASLQSKELSEVHHAWLPPWLVRQWAYYQDLAAVYWNEYGKPALDVLLQKASDKLSLVQKWAESYLELVKSKWIPAVKDQWTAFSVYIEPHLLSLHGKSIKIYELSKCTVAPYVLQVQELVNPYIQELRQFSSPYIDQVVATTKPHIEKAYVVLKPYTDQPVYFYANFLKSATIYHKQVQGIVQEKLKNYNITNFLATKELVWLMAFALLALPVVFLFKLLSAILCKKRRPSRSAQPSHTNRRHKRRHADK